MILEASKKPGAPKGVLIDTGTGKPIRWARKADMDTGEWEALTPAGANDESVAVDPDTRQLLIRKGRAVGQLKLVPLGEAHLFGATGPPKPVEQKVVPVTEDEKVDGLEQYKRVYTEVWQWRGESKRCVQDRFEQYLASCGFLDNLILKRVTAPVRVLT